ncbi:MAG: choice-of-anchor D domain-containing protein [Archangium sp.]|nr:choice-of-anchor D domain-containing protein [Archangium sp.]MDP3573635.1 choice-of-anchor D domain-containing protein [Archangium sp.]
MRAISCLVFLALVSCARESISTTEPNIEVQPLALDFGPIPVGLQVSLPVQVRNLGKSALVLSPVTVEGADFAGPTTETTIGAGERQTIELSFLPTAEGLRNGVVHLINNSVNDTDVALVVTGQGIPRLVCAECNAPPAAYCASGSVLINYQPHGSCVNNRCEYQANTTICGGMCVAATMSCSAPMVMDAGVDAGSDAGFDAGVDAGVDAGLVDAGMPGGEFTVPGVMMWTVPAGVTSVTINAWGGGGAGGVQLGSTGGGGAFARATFGVTPGELLEVQVAEGGVAPGNGAGASAVLRGTTPLIIVAGGGGGGSDGNSGNSGQNGRGGAGGALTGQDGQNLVGQIAPYCTGATGGRGGTATAGGLGGSASGTAFKCLGQPGAMGAGGRASGVNSMCDMGVGAVAWQQGGGQGNGGGGAGGSGLFGGGGAGFIWTYCAGGGGGGSSFVAPGATMASMIGGMDQAQGNAAASMGAGAGGTDDVGGRSNPNSNGKHGRVVITY